MQQGSSIRCRFVGALACAAVPALALVPAHAHHGVAQYDMQTVRALAGIVQRWDWRTPHTWLTLAVRTADGTTELWEIEGAPPGWMAGQGWSPDSLASGEAVSVKFHPARRAPQAGILMEVERAGGAVLKVNRPARLGGP